MSRRQRGRVALVAAGLLLTVMVLSFVLLRMRRQAQREAAHRAEQAARQQPPARTLEPLFALPAFTLTDHAEQPFGTTQLAGKVWVANFLFTRCAGPCPILARKMADLTKRLPQADLRFVTFSVDPDHDTPAVLAAYAARYEAGPRWRLLTGKRTAIHQLANKGFKLSVIDDPDDPEHPITHTARFVLVDGQGKVRATYHGDERDTLDLIQADVERLLASRGETP